MLIDIKRITRSDSMNQIFVGEFSNQVIFEPLSRVNVRCRSMIGSEKIL